MDYAHSMRDFEYDENGWAIVEPSDCLDFHLGDCDGAVEFRMPLSATGKSFVRCDKHWFDRLDIQEGINASYCL